MNGSLDGLRRIGPGRYLRGKRLEERAERAEREAEDLVRRVREAEEAERQVREHANGGLAGSDPALDEFSDDRVGLPLAPPERPSISVSLDPDAGGRQRYVIVSGSEKGPFLAKLVSAPNVDPQQDTDKLLALSDRNAELLWVLMKGFSSSETAAELDTSPAALREQIAELLSELDVQSQLAAVAMAYRAGWSFESWATSPARLGHPTSPGAVAGRTGPDHP